MSRLPALQLSNEFVRLELSSLAHVEGLQKATADGELWRLWYTTVPTIEGVAAEIERRLGLFEQGKMIPLTIIRTLNGVDEIVGMTSFMNIEQTPLYQRAEIGSTWYSPRVQRTVLNTAVKHLMLEYAFEQWKVIAVEFRTHRLNTQSRRAIERLGAQLDGILRAHQIMPNGTLRDTAVYSIGAHEWPAIKTHLEFKIQQYQ
ncbi:GNAT family N-acetyltransferase [Hydromonas duriensis]|uniref:RimJ/RimL family protein N-acetyltransferase n=1 Tax=Hydromonas duriensis TaxID=1527608 RepID=A0A4R6Y9X3_9BURK|nr:GNAT family protein [Hydromonas duriensis]TDR32320.1 RimJ/RimL family protein N-acetyltransferase [Hydromonas duriensis]